MSSADHGFNIAELPSDVIRHILRVGQESIEGMRLLSPRWNDLSLEHLSNRKRLPIILSLKWHIEAGGEEYYSFRVKIASKYADFFGVPNKLIIESWFDSRKCIFGVQRKFGIVKKQEWFSKRLSRLIDRCSSIKILEIDVVNFDKKELTFKHIRSVLGDADIRNLFISDFRDFTQQSVSNMVALVSPLSVHRLVLNLGTFYRSPAIGFKSYWKNVITMLTICVRRVGSIDLIATDWTGSGRLESDLTEYWASLAAVMSEYGNVVICCNIEKQNTSVRGVFDYIITVTARKHAS